MSFHKILKEEIERIFNSLQGGFQESIYQNALAIEIRKLGFKVEKEINKSVMYLDQEVGIIRIDLIINDQIIIEMKTIPQLKEKERNQLKRYLKLFNVNEGYLINFRLNDYEIEKIIYKK